jgi:hypothetical protein
MKDDEIVFSASQASEHPEKADRPERLPFSSRTGAGKEEVGLFGHGVHEKRVVADFENTKRFRRRGRLWGPLHADVCLFCPDDQ